jgi:hypothetical protein
MHDQAETLASSHMDAPFDTRTMSLRSQKTKTTLLTILLITLASIPHTPTTSATYPGLNGKIAFCSKGTHDNWQIYIYVILLFYLAIAKK